MEVPILQPIVDRPSLKKRYFVNGAKKSIEKASSHGSTPRGADDLSSDNDFDMDQIKSELMSFSSACVHSVSDESLSVMVSTAGLYTNLNVLSLSVTPIKSNNNQNLTPDRIELDLSDVFLKGDTLVKTASFIEANTGDLHYEKDVAVIRLNLLFSSRKVLVLHLGLFFSDEKKSGIDLISSTVYPQVEIFDFSPHSPDNMNTSASISHGAAEWLNSNVLVFSCAQSLICADISTDSMVEWDDNSTYSKVATTPGKRNRRSTFGTMLSYISLSQANMAEEMSPIVSLSSTCPTNVDGDDDDKKHVLFSLHTDGIVRLWSISLPTDGSTTKTLYPDSVRQIKISRDSLANVTIASQYQVEIGKKSDDDDDDETSDPPLPPSTLWDPSCDALHMTSRLYASDSNTFALAISVKTLVASPIISPSLLLVLHGNVEQDMDYDNTTALDNCLVMNIPPHIDHVSHMTFSSHWRCELQCLFQSKNLSNDLSIARYPPSSLAFVTRSPMLTASTLDQIVEDETFALQNLSLQTVLGGQSNSNDNKQQEQRMKMLREIDTYYMRRLFSSSFLGIVGNRPLAFCIEKALSKLVPQYSSLSTTGSSNKEQYQKTNNNIEVNTLLAVRDWERSDEIERLVESRVPTTTSSNRTNESNSSLNVYDVFATPNKTTNSGSMSMIDEDEYDDEQQQMNNDSTTSKATESEESKLSLHHLRWKKLLMGVWEEHGFLLSPLQILSLSEKSESSSTSSQCIIFRVGVASAVMKNNDAGQFSHPSSNNSSSSISKLQEIDNTAMSLFQNLLQNKAIRKKLLVMEESLYQTISSAQNVADTKSNFIHGLQKELKEIAVNLFHGRTEAIFSTLESLEMFFDDMSDDECVCENWLQSIPQGVFSRIPHPFFSQTNQVSSVVRNSKGLSSNFIASTDFKTTASFLTKIYLKSSRNLALSRVLLLLGLPDESDEFMSAISSAIKLYLTNIATDWVSNQMMEEEIKTESCDNSSEEEKEQRGSSGGGQGGLRRFAQARESSTRRSVLDGYTDLSMRVEMSKKEKKKTPDSSLSSIIASSFSIAKCFTLDSIPVWNANGSSLSTSPPLIEFGLLERWHQPRLALRLLVPTIKVESNRSIHDVYMPAANYMELARVKVLAAECLLIEASFLSNNELASQAQCKTLRNRAADLHLDANDDNEKYFGVVDKYDVDVDTVFDVLTKDVQNWWENSHNNKGGSDEKQILRELERLMSDSSSTKSLITAPPITRLARLPSCRALISSWIMRKDKIKNTGNSYLYLPFFPDENAPLHIRLFFHKLRTVSHLLERLSLIERHTTDHSLMLDCADDVIKYLNGEFPKEMVDNMSETATLWSATFQYALKISNWSGALRACWNNPIPARRNTGLRRLVVGMIESGSLDDLLLMISPTTSHSYDGDSEEMGYSSSGIGSSMLGSNSAQPIDFYESAVSILEEQAIEHTKRSQYQISEDTGTQNASDCDFRMCLYSLHASRGNWKRASEALNGQFEASSMMLRSNQRSVKNRAAENMSLSALGCSNSLSIVEQKHHQFFLSAEKEEEEQKDDGFNGSLQFPTLKLYDSLERRALLSVFWNTACNMNVSEPSRIPLSSDVIGQLVQSGNFFQSIVLAKSMSRGLVGDTKTFVDLLSKIICNYLVPVAIALSRSSPLNNNDDSRTGAPSSLWEEQICESQTPTLAQLVHAISMEGGKDTSDSFCYINDEWKYFDNVRGKAAMELVRVLTVKYSNSNNTLAMNVAKTFLDLDNGRASLPFWLSDLLMKGKGKQGKGKSSGDGDCSGLFANPPQKTGLSSDPSSLLRLFIKKGLLVQACDLVRSVLMYYDNSGTKRKSEAHKRLPEKGHIDFVPYASIDMLHDIIDLALRGEVPGLKVDAIATEKLTLARDRMVKALEFHFELLKASERGVQSARALARF